MPNVVTSNANSRPGSAVTTRQVVNQIHGPRRLKPTNRAATPPRRDQTSVAKHSGLQRASRRGIRYGLVHVGGRGQRR